MTTRKKMLGKATSAAAAVPVDITPESDLVPFTVRMPEELHKQLRQAAFDSDVSQQSVVLSAVRMFFERSEAARDKHVNPFADATPDEKRTLATVLAMIRTGNKEVRKIVAAMAESWRRASAA